ncbi:hypothetical protein DPMN_050665 [Dreissena polymorpha]|uniref:Uncharacterized protein n=1 Tax=Dreissena polymorpha TaxID=45954 RepID=A0A9D4CHZ2_DREPO|nr:hypothetical protein DPMN_050665 [Dreissena polymorpha]
MSTLIEDPHIPLVGMNGRKRVYSVCGGSMSSMSTAGNGSDAGGCIKQFKNGKPHPYHFETVGNMLAMRKELFQRRKRYCDVSLCLALAGVGILILENRAFYGILIDRSSLLSFLMKNCITAFTVACSFSGHLPLPRSQLFAVDKRCEDLRLAMSARRVARLL